MSHRTRTGTYRSATGFSYSRPIAATGLQGATRPPPPTSTTSTEQQGSSGSTQPSGSRSCCDICSFSQKPPAIKKNVYHDHFSSKALRELLDVEFALSGSYSCPSCKISHSPYPTERTKVVLSDSTLHKFFAPPTPTKTSYSGDTLHVDYVTIPGATLETIFHAFKIEYSHHTKPMDLFIVAGYNDLIRNTDREVIIDKINEFVEYVRALTNEDNTTNTVTIGTFLYPPQLAWFENNGPEPNNYRNQKGKIDWLNGKIDEINLKNGMGHYVGVHKHGMRVVNKKIVDEYGQVQQHLHYKRHRWEHWREKDPQNMLHLTNERRFVLGTAINEYFINRT